MMIYELRVVSEGLVCRYAVVMLADNGFGGFGETSDIAVLLTKPARLAAPRIVSARMTQVLIQWDAASGRQENLYGFNVSYRIVSSQAGLTNTGAGFAFSLGSGTQLAVNGLQPNCSYVFAVSAVNAGGAGDFSTASIPVQTQAVDHLASCTLYPANDGILAGAAAPSGSIVLQELIMGLGSVSGIISGLPVSGAELNSYGGAGWALSIWQYGQSQSGFLGQVFGPLMLNASTVIVNNSTLGAISISTTAVFSLHGPGSLVGGTLVLQLMGPSTASTGNLVVARCELGVSRPRDTGAINDASPSVSSQSSGQAFCTLRGTGNSDSRGGGDPISGGFIAAIWDAGKTTTYSLEMAGGSEINQI